MRPNALLCSITHQQYISPMKPMWYTNRQTQITRKYHNICAHLASDFYNFGAPMQAGNPTTMCFNSTLLRLHQHSQNKRQQDCLFTSKKWIWGQNAGTLAICCCGKPTERRGKTQDNKLLAILKTQFNTLPSVPGVIFSHFILPQKISKFVNHVFNRVKVLVLRITVKV